MNYLSLIVFTLATCGTPGPNNTLVMASGVSFGFRRSVPGVVGINTGFPIMVVLVGLGLGAFLERWPVVLDILRPIGAAYLLYLAYKIATAPVDDLQARATKPLTFTKTALFQFVNPKAWVMIVGALVTYTTTDGPFLWQVLAVAVIFLVFGTPCTTAWLLMGVGLRRVISKPAQFRAFNIVMAVTLVLSMIPILFEIRDSPS
ncbi:MAG: LysE family translocator [Jatrophihabitantaceae bacterium]